MTKKKEMKGNFIKFQNIQNALDKMVKDLEFARSELKSEEEKSVKYIVEILVCLLKN